MRLFSDMPVLSCVRNPFLGWRRANQAALSLAALSIPLLFWFLVTLPLTARAQQVPAGRGTADRPAGASSGVSSNAAAIVEAGGLVTNASAGDATEIVQLFQELSTSLAARNATELKLFGLDENPAKYVSLSVTARVTHIAVAPSAEAPTSALVRQRFRIAGTLAGEAFNNNLAGGIQDVALMRLADGRWAFTGRRWSLPANAIQVLSSAAREEWQTLLDSETEDGAAGNAASHDVLLHLVAERRAGRWIALRRSRWNGRVFEPANLATRERRQGDSESWISEQIAKWSNPNTSGGLAATGTLHLILQRGTRDWVGLDGVWEGGSQTRNARNRETNSGEAVATIARLRMAVESSSYGNAIAHRDLAQALSQAGLFGEAADEWEKAELLRPGLVGAQRLQEVAAQRAADPAMRAARELQDEARIGLVDDHPTFTINALVREQRSQPTLLRALRLGLEYSKLGDDAGGASYLTLAQQMMRQGGLNRLSNDERAWIELLLDHLEERKRLALIKPPNPIRSALFTVRSWPNEASVLPLLASLESSQHTVYADFRIPMGSTEVVLWSSQSEFQSYTSRFSAQGSSEFVAALTLTKLIATEEGPWVLGEEINVFIDPRLENNTFSTVAHEYGHVAVRQLSRGRTVPVWFNEGVAAAVEGGYDGYVLRVRNARAANRLLTMREMQEWNVDGERAFLAYSQANSMIDFIVEKWGANAVLEILRQIGRDVAPEDAFRSALGISSGQLWQRWIQEASF
ncbi:MAG: hypothetical protein JWN98_2245 [Abditibacteriota bacterium]|nr:hypothetical protein [Abditibacteriota bacterium]